MVIHQDARIYATILNEADSVTHTLDVERTGYIHVIRGTVNVNGTALKGGDALKLTRETQVTLDKAEAAEVLVFDLPY